MRRLGQITIAAEPERSVLAAEKARLVHSAVAKLAPRPREVVSRRFGLDGGGEIGVAALALDLHLSERRARTIECDALHKLAVELERSRLTPS